ncbi:hypothetical protein ACIQAA_14100 [Neobacillus sp. NPDC093182]|uniref:hypothetical protein n=1 Tax=Neobacillus sp. NPDC093182 TaxID=3364297 RepID=UPI00380408A7
MREINLVHLMSMLIRDYEKVCGRARFEIKKIDGTFTLIDIHQKLLDLVNLQRNNLIGKKISDLPIKRDWTEKLLSIFEKAWKGKETIYYLFPPTNDNIFLVVQLEAVVKNGVIDRIEGCCVPLESKELKGRFMESIISHDDEI